MTVYGLIVVPASVEREVMQFVLRPVLLWSICVSLVVAEDKPVSNDAFGRTFDALTRKVGEYRFAADEPTFDARLHPKPVLRWTNPIRNTIDSGVFLWTSRGRPVALMSAFWSGRSSYEHEFQSLADHRFKVQLDDKRWAPSTATKYEVFEEEVQVSENRRLRLIQMRRLAQSLQAFLVKPNSREKLRLLSDPLYRYPEDINVPNVVDGGVFVFVQATDPEIILVLEARERSNGRAAWYAGYGRMSAYQLVIKRNAETVREWGYDSGGAAKEFNVFYHKFMKP